MVEISVATKCPACGTQLSEEGRSAGLCPSCLLELALEDSALDAEVVLEPGEAPTLQYTPHLAFSEGAIQGERYRIRSLLGRGGMGEVWRAYDLKLRQDVALKALRKEMVRTPDALETLRREVRVAREVVSPNVCRVFDLEEIDGQELVSMEYVDGTTLQEILRERGPLDLNEAREIASQFLAGLESIHEAGLVHRDIKPENLMLTRTGRVVVMDFGIAKGLADGKGGLVAGTPAYMSPEQVRGDELDARADVFSAGVVLAEMVEPGGLSTFEDRQRLWKGIHQETPEIAETPWSKLIAEAVAADREERLASASDLAQTLEEVTLRAAGDETARPYPGLAAFQKEDAEFFYGRELEVEALWKKLRRPRLLAVIGPSGAGKSSFLRAGLLPTLPDGWSVIVATPGHRPLENLARALEPEIGDVPGAAELLARFQEPGAAVEVLSEWRRAHEHVLVIVDQFEELFTQNGESAQQAFAEMLSQLPLEADALVLLCMRDDFLFHCHRFEGFRPILSDLTLLGPPTGASLRRALVQPAIKCGYRFEEEGIIEEMLSEVEGERGALPTVAFAAARLWDERDRETGLLTREAYETIGGVGGALAQHAETILEKIGEDRIPIVRELFRNLVTAQGTRVARDRDQLLSVFDSSGQAGSRDPGFASAAVSAAEVVLDTLIDARLLTSYKILGQERNGEPHHRIEIVHESLLTHWPRLVRWQMQDAEGAKLRDELRSQARLWEEHDRSEDYLWTGTAYQEFQLWRGRYPGGLSAAEDDFARAMTAHAERRKRRRRAAVAAAFLILLAVLSIVTWSRFEAVAEARRAEAAKLLALAQLKGKEDPTEALAYTTASLELADTNEARVFALRALSEAPLAFQLPLEGEGHQFPAFSPDGNRLAIAGMSQEIRIFSAEGGSPLILPGHISSTGGVNLPRWITSDRVLTGNPTHHRARIWSLPAGEVIHELTESGPGYWGVREETVMTEVFGTDEETGHDLYHLHRWHLPEGTVEDLGTVDVTAIGASDEWTFLDRGGRGWVYIKENEAFLKPMPVSEAVPDRRVAAHDNAIGGWETTWSGNDSNDFWTIDGVTAELRQWDLDGPEMTLLRVIPAPSGLEGAPRPPDASGRWLSSVTRQISLWKADSWPGTRPLRLRSSGSWQSADLDIHPRGDLAVGLTHGGSRLSFWPLEGTRPAVVDGDSLESNYLALAFSPDGGWLAVARWDPRTLELWPLPGSRSQDVQTLTLPEAYQGPWRIAFDPQMRFAAIVGGPNDWVEVVPLDGSPSRILEGFTDRSFSQAVAVSPSGRQIASAPSRQGPWTLRLWDLETGKRRLFDLPESASSSAMGRVRAVWSLVFSDESTLYTSGDGGVRRWNLETGGHEVVLPLPPEYGALMEVAEDGRTALAAEVRLDELVHRRYGVLKLVDLLTGEQRALPAFGENPRSFVLDRSGTVVATGDSQGSIRVGKVSTAEPHLLLGHEEPINKLAISPDSRWIASTSEDGTLRLWPMPDLDEPPLQVWPHDQLLAKLQSLTNLRVVRDEASSTGWSIALEPFPGWQELPTWP